MRKLFIILILLVANHGLSQQNAQFSQWVWNPLALNPAHAGIKNCSELKVLSRLQWLGFQGAPWSSTVLYSNNLETNRKKVYSPRHGIGFKLLNDNFGPITTNNLALNYAFHLNFTQDNRLSVGISGGLRQFIFNSSQLTTFQPDPILKRSTTQYTPLVGMGLWWNTKNYYIGLSFEELASTDWKDVGQASGFRLHWMLTSGVKFQLSDDFTLIPNLLLKKTLNSPLTLDLCTTLDLYSMFKVGVGFRNQDAFVGLFQVKLPKGVVFGYSCDYVFSDIQRVSMFSHEVSLMYSNCSSVDKSRLACPLF